MRKNQWNKRAEIGSAMLLTTILLLTLSIVIGTVVTISHLSLDVAMFEKNTSNSYGLAENAIEKQVQHMNALIENKKKDILLQIQEETLQNASVFPVKDTSTNIETNFDALCSKITYENERWQIKDVEEKIRLKLYEALKQEYFQDEANPKKFEYCVQSDRDSLNSKTIVQVQVQPIIESGVVNKEKVKIISILQTVDESVSPKQIHEKQQLEAIVQINIPSSIEACLIPSYKWIAQPADIVDSALTCFSDVVITEGATLDVVGDMRVKGNKSNHVSSGSNFCESDQNGGVLVTNGGNLITKRPNPSNTKSTNTGSIYCLNNVATSNGWIHRGTGPDVSTYQKETKIMAEGDVIADTVAIFDDFYQGGVNQSPFGGDTVIQKNSIDVQGNVFVDNDVKIDEYVADSKINVEGSIFGVSDGLLTPEITTGVVDANASSSVFNLGRAFHTGTSPIIRADGIFVNGHPYIEIAGIWCRLFESVGEPYKNVHSYEEYNKNPPNKDGTNNYLNSNQNFPLYDQIKKDKIEIKEKKYIYTPADTYVSAKVEGTDAIAQYSDSTLGSNQLEAKHFFYEGTDITINNFTIKDFPYQNKKQLFHEASLKEYYSGISRDLQTMPTMYFKKLDNLGEAGYKNHLGIRGYMTTQRSVFYGPFEQVHHTPDLYEPKKLSFLDAVALGGLSETTWDKHNAVCIVDSTSGEVTIDIANFQDRPTLVIDMGNKLKLTNSSNVEFEGIIITNGDLEVDDSMTITGSILIGGTAIGSMNNRALIMTGIKTGLKIANGNTLKIIHDPDMLFKINVNDEELQHKILDALHFTKFSAVTVADTEKAKKILGEQGPYTIGKIILSEKSKLDIQTEGINCKIQTVKKVNP